MNDVKGRKAPLTTEEWRECAMSTERESIARYLEHIAQQDIGTLIDGLTPREVAQFAASWVRNELDVKWAAEVLGRAIDSRGEREPRDNGEVSAIKPENEP